MEEERNEEKVEDPSLAPQPDPNMMYYNWMYQNYYYWQAYYTSQATSQVTVDAQASAKANTQASAKANAQAPAKGTLNTQATAQATKASTQTTKQGSSTSQPKQQTKKVPKRRMQFALEPADKWIEERRKRHPANSQRPVRDDDLELGEIISEEEEEEKRKGKKKGRNCKYFAKGHCRNGDSCTFRHLTCTKIRSLVDVLADKHDNEVVLPSREDAERMRIAWSILEDLLNA